MPVAVVALAAGSFAAGATAFAAAGTLIGAVAAGATMVGSALTIVGTVTGNQKLTKIGALVGIAGGLGTMAVNAAAGASAVDAAAAGASGADAAGSVADAAGSAAADAGSAITTSPVNLSGAADITPLSEAAGTSTATSAAVSPTASMASSAAAPAGGMLDAAAPAGQASATASQSVLNPMDASSTTVAQSIGNPMDASATTVGQASSMDAFKTPNPFAGNANVASGNYLGSIENSGMLSSTMPQMPAPTGIGATLDQVQTWAKQNPVLAQAALNGGSAMLKGVLPSTKDKAMMDAYRAQQQLTSAQTATLNRRALWGSGRIS